MRKSKVFIGLLLSVVLGLSFIVGWAVTHKTAEVNKSRIQDPLAKQAKSLPEHLSYWILFQHQVKLDEKAKEVEAKGENGAKYRIAMKRATKLNDSEGQLLEEVSHETYFTVKAIDERAKRLIDELRKQPPDPKFHIGQRNPPVHPKLKALQRERDEAIKGGMERLTLGFGEARYEHLNKFVKKNITPNFTNLTLDAPRRNFDPRTDPKIQKMIEDARRSND